MSDTKEFLFRFIRLYCSQPSQKEKLKCHIVSEVIQAKGESLQSHVNIHVYTDNKRSALALQANGVIRLTVTDTDNKYTLLTWKTCVVICLCVV